MLKAVSYLKPMARGVTSPQLFAADDGAAYVVKFQTNTIGPKVLVNELLAARLGELWGLCFPPADMIQLTDEVLAPLYPLFRRVPAGLHFASRYLRGCRYLSRNLLTRADNKQDMAGVILFDHLFHNVDRTRNPRNLLIRREDSGWRLYAIDHSHLFYKGNWTVAYLGSLAERVAINRQRAFGVLLKHYLSAADFAASLERVNATTDSMFACLVKEIPQEWLPEANERTALLEWLCRRRDMAALIAEQLCSLTQRSQYITI